MTPQARQIINEIAALRGIDPRLIIGRCRVQNVFRARIEVAERLAARSYSTSQIGQILNKDHTTIVYYLGGGKRRPSAAVWRAPRVRHLCFIRTAAPPKRRRLYLQPYAGADWTDYVWQERS